MRDLLVKWGAALDKDDFARAIAGLGTGARQVDDSGLSPWNLPEGPELARLLDTDRYSRI
jgi:hypothetical protein